MPGLTEFISWLEGRGLRKAAVTNAPKDNTLLMLAALELDTYFEAVVLGEECERAKPHPDPYLKALKLLGLQPHEAIVIEDSPSGNHSALCPLAGPLPPGPQWCPVWNQRPDRCAGWFGQDGWHNACMLAVAATCCAPLCMHCKRHVQVGCCRMN